MGYLRNRGTKQRPEWYIRYRDLDGTWKQRHSHQTTKEAARTMLTDAEARVKRGLQGMAEPTPEEQGRKAITVGELVARFLGQVEGDPGYAPPRIKSISNYRRDARSVLKRITPKLGSRPASSIRLQDVERVRDAQIAAGLAGESVIHTLGTLSKLYNWARRQSLVECANPVAGVERPRVSHSIDYLSHVEVGQLLARVASGAIVGVASWQGMVLAPMVATALFCGLRKGELFGLRWSDVHLDAGRLDVMRSYRDLPKSGKARHVPIHPTLATILRAWLKLCPTTPEGLVFPLEAGPGRLRMGVKEDSLELLGAFKMAACHRPADGKPWHMLRHTFASHFVMAGGSLFTLQRILGHSTPTMTQRYAHLAPDFLAAEVARMTFAAATSPAGIADLDDARRRRVVEG